MSFSCGRIYVKKDETGLVAEDLQQIKDRSAVRRYSVRWSRDGAKRAIILS